LVTLARDALQDLLPHFVRNSGPVEVIVFGALFILLLQNARGGLIPALVRRLPPRVSPVPAEAPPLPVRTYPQPGSAVLSVRGATRRFGGLVAVSDVAFDLRAGEILGLIGPNGAGKSTMFNLITGALPPHAGRITLLGHNVTGRVARHIAALGVARSFQHLRLRPSMTVLENVMLGTHLRTGAGMLAGAFRLDRHEERQARAEAMRQLRRVGLGDRPHEMAGNLPMGQQRVLEVARALAADPVLLVLDEPAAGLRRPEKQVLAALLRQVRASGVTILLVEHDMEFVMDLVDRLVVMDFGILLAEGTPAEIRANPAVQEAYLGGVA
jgi:branched-chain amino acid transport system permease protein